MNAVVRDATHKRITLKFQDEQMAKAISDDAVVLQANIAYMIFPTKPLAAGEKYIMENYQMETGSPEPTFVKPTLLPAGSGDNGYTYRFIGTYLSQWQQGVDNGKGFPIYMPKHSYFLGQSGDKHVFFYQTGETGRWNPFTATVQVFKGSHTTISTTPSTRHPVRRPSPSSDWQMIPPASMNWLWSSARGRILSRRSII